MQIDAHAEFLVDDDSLFDLAVRVGELLKRHGHYLTTAESCTGGWIAKCVTDVAGSSAWFERGWITYGNAAKCELLGVSEDTLSRHGAVGIAVVEAMTAGALRHSIAQVALAVSGIAGPDGGTADKPVGTVCFAWRQRGGAPVSRCLRFSGEREAVRRQAAAAALNGVLALYGNPDPA